LILNLVGIIEKHSALTDKKPDVRKYVVFKNIFIEDLRSTGTLKYLKIQTKKDLIKLLNLEMDKKITSFKNQSFD
jgi:hypothetical protein